MDPWLDINLLNNVLKTIAIKQDKRLAVGTDAIIQELKILLMLFQIVMAKLNGLGYAQGYIPNISLKITNKGLIYLHENGLAD